jgi:putative acetyltransferase
MSDSEPKIEIVGFRPQYARHFRDINTEWLEKYFSVEPYDRIVLNDPRKHILERGGRILFARVDDEFAGTCALLKHTENKYELAKMGVLERFQDLGVGRKLIEAAIDEARSLGATTLVLATSKLLDSANRLYQSMGFLYVDSSVIGPLPYERETVAMSLDL